VEISPHGGKRVPSNQTGGMHLQTPVLCSPFVSDRHQAKNPKGGRGRERESVYAHLSAPSTSTSHASSSFSPVPSISSLLRVGFNDDGGFCAASSSSPSSLGVSPAMPWSNPPTALLPPPAPPPAPPPSPPPPAAAAAALGPALSDARAASAGFTAERAGGCWSGQPSKRPG
jgi:hypothetical protein